MKTRILPLIAACFAAIVAFAIPAQAGHKISLDQVPAPVKATIQREVQTGKLGEIERETAKDKPTVYEVEYTAADGKAYELKIAEDGKLLAKEAD